MSHKKFFPFNTKWERKEYFEILEKATHYLKNCKKILDIGCGKGESVYFLENKYKANIMGLEITNYKENWNKISKNIQLYNGIKIPFKENYFDGVLLNNSFEHVKYKDKLVKDVGRVTKKGAKIILILPTPKYWFIKIFRYFFGELKRFRRPSRTILIHEPQVYGWNFIQELIDYFNWEKIVSKHFKIIKKFYVKNNENIVFVCEIK